MKKEKVRIREKLKLLALAMSVGIFGMIAAGFTALQVQAAQPPVISDLRVSESGDGQGIVARCSYQNYSDQSGCEMTLHLFRREESGQVSILSWKSIPYAADGNLSTDVYQPQEGVYFASVGINYGSEAVQTYSQSYYRVKINDGKVEVTEIAEAAGDANSENQNKTPGSEKTESATSKSGEEKSKGEACQHNLEYELKRQATAKQDSLLAYQCTLCGAVMDYREVPNSAYGVFLKEAAEKIRNARESEVVIDTDRWMSFNGMVLEALESRRDVTVSLHYQYQGQRHNVRIPAGEDVSGLADENGYCGFLHLTQVFGEESRIKE